MVKVIKKTLDFNKQQKGKGLPLDLSRIATVFDRTRLRILTKTSKTNDAFLIESLQAALSAQWPVVAWLVEVACGPASNLRCQDPHLLWQFVAIEIHL